MTWKRTSQHQTIQKVRHDVKNDINVNLKNTSWHQKVRHNVKNYVITSHCLGQCCGFFWITYWCYCKIFNRFVYSRVVHLSWCLEWLHHIMCGANKCIVNCKGLYMQYGCATMGNFMHTAFKAYCGVLFGPVWSATCDIGINTINSLVNVVQFAMDDWFN